MVNSFNTYFVTDLCFVVHISKYSIINGDLFSINSIATYIQIYHERKVMIKENDNAKFYSIFD